MRNVAQNLSQVWRTRKGLIVLLLAGGVICVLAVLAPQAWATPDQERLSQSITDFNDNPTPPDCLWQCDGPVYLSTLNSPFGTLTQNNVDLYITNNISWTIDVTTVDDPGVTIFNQTTVDILNGDFNPNPSMIWASPVPGYFDVFIDVDGDRMLTDGDGLLSAYGFGPTEPEWVGAGICVVPCEVGGVSKPAVRDSRPLWIALGGLVIVTAAVALVWTRRRGESG